MLRDEATPQFSTPESVQEMDQMMPLPLSSLIKRMSSKTTIEEPLET